MRVQARFFALYRERAGHRVLDFDLPGVATVADLVAEVTRAHPTLWPDPSKVVVAVNREYADHRHSLNDGDEVAFIPPVSGG